MYPKNYHVKASKKSPGKGADHGAVPSGSQCRLRHGGGGFARRR